MSVPHPEEIHPRRVLLILFRGLQRVAKGMLVSVLGVIELVGCAGEIVELVIALVLIVAFLLAIAGGLTHSLPHTTLVTLFADSGPQR